MKERVVVFKRRGRPDLRAVLGAPLAAGGSSVVHAAWTIDPGPGQPVELVVKRARPGTERGVERERTASARFDHPHLVAYLGATLDDELGPMLALERLAANPLLLGSRADVRCRFRDPETLYYPLPPGVALELGFDLLVALESLHAHGCVHADVKLANFLVRTPAPPDDARAVLAAVARGEFEGVLADMGSVRSLESVRRAAKGDDEPLPAITPIYAPPETVLDGGSIAKRLSPSMDAYAFGLVLYALLTGRAPYSALVDEAEARHPIVLAELKTREARGEIGPLDESALDELPLHDVGFARGAQKGWPAFRSNVAHLLRRCTDPDPARRFDARGARTLMERAFDIRRRAGERRACQGVFTLLPESNRLTGDAPIGRIRIESGRSGDARVDIATGISPSLCQRKAG